MRKIKDVFRLHSEGLSDRKVAERLGIGRGSVRKYRERAKDAGLSWPDVADMDDAVLERQLFTQTTSPDDPRFAEPDWIQGYA
jgi:transposase